MTNKIIISLSLLIAVALMAPKVVDAQYGQVLASETPEEVTIIHQVKGAGIGDVLNPAALVGGSLVLSGAYLYFDRKKKASFADFSFVK